MRFEIKALGRVEEEAELVGCSSINEADIANLDIGEESKVILLEEKRMERARLAQRIDLALSALPAEEQHAISRLFGLKSPLNEPPKTRTEDLHSSADVIDALRRLRRSASKSVPVERFHS